MDTRAESFLWYSYFGCTKEKAAVMEDDYVIALCARRAYRDLNRTLQFADPTSGRTAQEKARQAFRDAVCERIVQQAKGLKACGTQEAFDECHADACRDIQDTANGYLSEGSPILSAESFSYGQAQKWLNMTMKYLWLMKRVEGDFLHIPVDSIIMKKLSEKYELGFPRKKDGGLRKYSEYASKVWSKWNDKDYETFRAAIKNVKCDNKNWITWENRAWIEMPEA